MKPLWVKPGELPVGSDNRSYMLLPSKAGLTAQGSTGIKFSGRQPWRSAGQVLRGLIRRYTR